MEMVDERQAYGDGRSQGHGWLKWGKGERSNRRGDGISLEHLYQVFIFFPASFMFGDYYISIRCNTSGKGLFTLWQ